MFENCRSSVSLFLVRIVYSSSKKKVLFGAAAVTVFLTYYFYTKKYFKSERVIATHKIERTCGAGNQFLNQVTSSLRKDKIKLTVKSKSESGDIVLLVFCPVISRIGADIEATLQNIKDGRRIILVVMHHTPNSDYVVADSQRLVESGPVLAAVDCLFHENEGLLSCLTNDKAIDKVYKVLKAQDYEI